jgi:hypothetical protein
MARPLGVVCLAENRVTVCGSASDASDSHLAVGRRGTSAAISRCHTLQAMPEFRFPTPPLADEIAPDLEIGLSRCNKSERRRGSYAREVLQ